MPLSRYFGGQHALLVQLRRDHPELCHWSLQAVAEAWKRYSGDMHATLWVSYGGRDITFLGYILLMSQGWNSLDSSDLLHCQTAFQDWASHQAAVVRRRQRQV